MINERIYLRKGDDTVHLTTYVNTDGKNGPCSAVLVLPGGGYHHLAAHEGEKIALSYLAAGINAFVLHYSITSNNPDMRYPMPLVDASNAIKHIKDNAEKYNINPDRIFVLGFSAGGHLASMLGTLWHRSEVYENAEKMEFGYNKPCGMLLCYAVITPEEFEHKDKKVQQINTFKNLLGEGLSIEEYNYCNTSKYVDENTCPAFFWHTSEDCAVPVESAFTMAMAMRKHEIPIEMHIYPKGAHGLGLPDGTVKPKDSHICTWMPLSIEWIKSFN